MHARRRKSIRSKLFLTNAAVLIVIVLGFATALYVVLLQTYSNIVKNNQLELTSQMISRIDSFLAEMDTIALVAAGNPRLLAYFIELSERYEPENYFEQSLIDGVDASRLLANINGRNHTADRISVYNEKKDYISAGILYETNQKNGHDLPVSEWKEAASDRSCLVLGPHSDFWSDSYELLISVIRPLSNNYGSISYGVVEVQRRFSRLEDLLSFETQQRYVLVIFDAYGVPLYVSDPEWNDSNEHGNHIVQSMSSGIQTLPSKSNEVSVYGRSAVSSWSIMLIYPRNALYQTYSATFMVLIGGTLLLLIAMMLLVYFIADRLSRPIRELSESIRNIDMQNLCLDISDLGQDEVDDIQYAFQTFVSRLSQLSTKEIEAHMIALQSQINPHFLYNSLAVISAAGYESGNEKVTDICARLASLFRYAASDSTAYVTLADELAHMHDYLELMKKRYEDDFNFIVNIAGDPTHIKSPKLILQPIVENCFQHGFKDIVPPWHIEVLVEISETEWKATVIDDGAGIQPQLISDVYKRLDNYRKDSTFPKLSPGGTGMVNTAIRLYLTYNKNAIFSITSQPNQGAKVVIGGSV